MRLLALSSFAAVLVGLAMFLMAGRPAPRPVPEPVRICVFPQFDYWIGGWRCDELPSRRFADV